MKKYGLMMIILLFAAHANASNIDTFGIGSKATAMGGAFSAYADDVYAPYYNPAGLTQIKNPQFSIGAIVEYPDLKVQNFAVPALGIGPTDVEDDSPVLPTPHLGFAMPLNDMIGMGIAVYAPFGFDLKWPKNPQENPAAYNAFESTTARLVATPTVAFKFSDMWSFGVGASLGTAQNTAKLQSFDLAALGTAATGTPITAYEDVDVTDDFNWSVNAGVMFNPSDAVTIGVTYRSRTNTNYDGDLTFKDLDAAEVAVLNGLIQAGSGGAVAGLTKTKFDVSLDGLDFPDQVQAGLRYHACEDVSVEFDVVWTNWGIIDNEILTIDDPQLQTALAALSQLGGNPTTGQQIVTPRNWNDTVQIKTGIEWWFCDNWALRAGFFHDPTPIPDDTFDAVWADANKNAYSVGLGYVLNQWTIDTVFQYTKTEGKRYIGGESVNLNDSFGGAPVQLEAKGQIFGGGLTVGYAF